MVRLIKKEDYKAVLDIYNYYILNSKATFEITPLSLDEFSKRIDDIMLKYPFLVYEEDNKILGYAYLDSYINREASRFTADYSVYLDKDYLSKGIGAILYQEIEKYAVNMNIYSIMSLVTSSNDKSIRYHERLGFNEIATMKNVAYKFDSWLDLVYLKKDLNTFDKKPCEIKPYK